MRYLLWATAVITLSAAFLQGRHSPDQRSAAAADGDNGHLAAASALAMALDDDPQSQELSTTRSGIIEYAPIRVSPSLNDRFVLLPGHLIVTQSLTVTVEIQALTLYVRHASGQWSRREATRSCGNGRNLFALDSDALFAVAFATDGHLPDTASLAKIPPSHRRPNSCHADLGDMP